MDRRTFLRAVGGVVVALPFLESFEPRRAAAAPPGAGKFAIFLRQANGVVQKGNEQTTERYFPDAVGPVTPTSIPTDRALYEVKDYASKLLLVRGVNYGFQGNGCGHSGGGNQCLTAAKVSDDPAGNRSLAMGESIDNRIARELTPGIEPLTLYAGRMAGYINEVLSYRGAKQLRAAERNPLNAYNRLFKVNPVDEAAAARLALARKSVNDHVRDELRALMSRSDLSQADRQRLDLHFSSIRDTEKALACKLPDASITEMERLSPLATNPDYLVDVAKLQLDIIALSVACGGARAATLQIGDGNDSTAYTIDGVRYPSYHQISHRIFSDGATGDPIPNAVDKHHKIDRLHLQLFKYLLDKLSAYKMGSGTLLDQGVAVLTNDLANGPAHSYKNLPFVIAGGAAGFLKQGAYVDAGGVTNNKLLNTLGAAVGCKNAAGQALDDFGDPGLAKGLVPQMMA